MDVFISWSGQESELVARTLVELLPDVFSDLNAWMSEHDIVAGARWIHLLQQKLDSSNFGILCLTPENIASPWLLYEAGSLAKSVSHARVVPYRLNLPAADVPFPLGQFQGVDTDESGTKKLIESLNLNRDQPIDQSRLDRVFQRWYPDFRTRLEAIPASLEPARVHRADRELIEEILEVVRDNARSSMPEDPEAYSDSKVPKSAVWKTVHEVEKAELERMTDGDIAAYLLKVRERGRVTPHSEERASLVNAEQRAEHELIQRKNRNLTVTISPAAGGESSSVDKERSSD